MFPKVVGGAIIVGVLVLLAYFFELTPKEIRARAAIRDAEQIARNETKAKSDVHFLASAVRSYYAKNGTLPETLEELAEKDEKGRSELEDLPLDPWDTAYEMLPGDNPRDFEVISCGPDKQPETEDDISNKVDREDN